MVVAFWHDVDQEWGVWSHSLPGVHVLGPVLARRPGDLHLAGHVRVDQVHIGQLVDGQVHLAQRQPVQLELHLNPEIVPIFEVKILDNAGGQSEKKRVKNNVKYKVKKIS